MQEEVSVFILGPRLRHVLSLQVISAKSGGIEFCFLGPLLRLLPSSMSTLCEIRGVRISCSWFLLKAPCFILELSLRNLEGRFLSYWSLLKDPFSTHGSSMPIRGVGFTLLGLFLWHLFLSRVHLLSIVGVALCFVFAHSVVVFTWILPTSN